MVWTTREKDLVKKKCLPCPLWRVSAADCSGGYIDNTNEMNDGKIISLQQNEIVTVITNHGVEISHITQILGNDFCARRPKANL